MNIEHLKQILLGKSPKIDDSHPGILKLSTSHDDILCGWEISTLTTQV